MKIHSNKSFPWGMLALLVGCLILLSMPVDAQRLPRKSSRAGAARPAPSRNVSRPAPSREVSRPSPSRSTSTPSREVNRASSSKAKINGGQKISPDRSVKTPSNAREAAVERKTERNINTGDRNVNVGDRNINTGDRDINVGNRTDIDIGDRDVNINVDNSRDIVVSNNNRRTNYRYPPPRPPYRPYTRPPYRYGGFFYFSFHPFHYHPYRPYYWGPTWHPWGFFVATLATTAIIVSVNNQQYHYDEGVYYVESDGGYTVVPAPVGATVKEIPSNSEPVVVNETTNNYYYGGAFYEKSEEGYTVVPATAGTIVPNLPEGGEEVKLGDVTYVRFGDTYYQPILLDGKDMYEIVDVRDEEG